MQKPLTLWHFKVINQHHLSLGSASCLLLTPCSRAFIMFLPLVHTIKMCCSDTCISAKVILRGCQHTLSYCHEHQPLFFHWKPPWLSREKWLYINLSSLVTFCLRRTRCQLHYSLILQWFPASGSESENGEIQSCLQIW